MLWGMMSGILLTVLPAHAGPVPPVFQNPTVVSVQGASVQGSNAYAQSIAESQALDVKSKLLGSNLSLETTWANATNATPPGSSLIGFVTWINVTKTCVARSCPGASVDCDGVFVPGFFSPPSFRINRPCWILAPLFNGELFPASGAQAPNYTVTRLDTYLRVQQTQWFHPAPDEETTVANLSIIEAKHYGVNVTAYSAMSANWAVPYPQGNWNPQLTQVRYTNASQTVTTFGGTAQQVLLSWNGIPTGIQNYTISVFGTPGGTYGQGYGNLTVPQTVTLQALNETNIGNGNYQVTASWVNTYSSDFTGGFQITGSWVATAESVTLTANANPVATAVWTSTAVTVPVGTLNITNGSTVQFAVTFQIGSTFSLTSPVWTLNGIGLSWLDTFVIIGTVAIAVASYGAITGDWKSPLMAVAAVGLLALTGWVWLAL